MARVKNAGNGRLEEALALLIHNQAAFVAGQRETDIRISETDSRIAETERRIEERFSRIEALLLEHNRILEKLPDAVREKIGFKPPPS